MAEIGRHRDAEGDDAVVVELLERLRLTVPGEIGRRGVDMEMHREEPALDQIRLARLLEADRDVSFAHRQVELLVLEDQLQADVGI
jgi:hypothetical protein